MSGQFLWQIKISKEYPLRPPLFTLSLYEAIQSENYSKVDSSVWYNELRSMEAEVSSNKLNGWFCCMWLCYMDSLFAWTVSSGYVFYIYLKVECS